MSMLKQRAVPISVTVESILTRPLPGTPKIEMSSRRHHRHRGIRLPSVDGAGGVDIDPVGSQACIHDRC